MTDHAGPNSVADAMGSHFIRLAALACSLVATVWVSAAGSATRMVHLRGTAYEFNNVHTLLAGATIRVAEFPSLKTTVQPDGRYDLAVPDRARVTPYIVKPGYHTIYLQTFTTNGESLANVNFQTPTDAVYRALVMLLKVPVDSQGNLVACAIVSTFNTRNVRDLSFAQFIAYGARPCDEILVSQRRAVRPTRQRLILFREGNQNGYEPRHGQRVGVEQRFGHVAQPDQPARR